MKAVEGDLATWRTSVGQLISISLAPPWHPPPSPPATRLRRPRAPPGMPPHSTTAASSSSSTTDAPPTTPSERDSPASSWISEGGRPCLEERGRPRHHRIWPFPVEAAHFLAGSRMRCHRHGRRPCGWSCGRRGKFTHGHGCGAFRRRRSRLGMGDGGVEVAAPAGKGLPAEAARARLRRDVAHGGVGDV